MFFEKKMLMLQINFLFSAGAAKKTPWPINFGVKISAEQKSANTERTAEPQKSRNETKQKTQVSPPVAAKQNADNSLSLLVNSLCSDCVSTSDSVRGKSKKNMNKDLTVVFSDTDDEYLSKLISGSGLSAAMASASSKNSNPKDSNSQPYRNIAKLTGNTRNVQRRENAKTVMESVSSSGCRPVEKAGGKASGGDPTRTSDAVQRLREKCGREVASLVTTVCKSGVLKFEYSRTAQALSEIIKRSSDTGSPNSSSIVSRLRQRHTSKSFDTEATRQPRSKKKCVQRNVVAAAKNTTKGLTNSKPVGSKCKSLLSGGKSKKLSTNRPVRIDSQQNRPTLEQIQPDSVSVSSLATKHKQNGLF